jgi:hypothetical protein
MEAMSRAGSTPGQNPVEAAPWSSSTMDDPKSAPEANGIGIGDQTFRLFVL